MASGVKITDAVMSSFTEVTMKTSKTTKLKYAMYKFSDDLNQIIVHCTKKQSEVTEEDEYDTCMSTHLPENDVLYVAYDFPYVNKEGVTKSDVVFVSWNPQGCSLKKKMLLASSLNSMRNKLKLNSKFVIEAEDRSEVCSDAVLEKIGGTSVKKEAKGDSQQAS